MTYFDQWRALSSRIRGLMQAAQLYTGFLKVDKGDPYCMSDYLHEQSKNVLLGIETFKNSFSQLLPPMASMTIDGFIDKTRRLINDENGSRDAKRGRVWTVLVLFVAFESEMSFILSDFQESIRARSERAFSHLQRSIVADDEFRGKWKKAFNEGEIECEKLGAVHLLLHGIWAFKVNARGERTDLVFQEPAGDLTNEQRYVDGLVLTEWKKAGHQNEIQKKFEEARQQADRYAQGSLYGIELSSYRYIIVVSSSKVVVPQDVRNAGVVYRHINIAVDPGPPSKR